MLAEVSAGGTLRTRLLQPDGQTILATRWQLEVGPLRQGVLSSDGKAFAVVAVDGRVYAGTDAAPRLVSTVTPGSAVELALSGDARFVVILEDGYDARVCTWDGDSYDTCPSTSSGSFEPDTQVAFSSPVGLMGLGNRKIIDVARVQGDSINRLTQLPLDNVQALVDLAISADGRRVAALTNRGLFIWHLDEPNLVLSVRYVASLFAPTDRVVLSPAGVLVARMQPEGPASFWQLTPQGTRDRICRTVTRNLSADEWRQYVGDAPYQRTCPELPEGRGTDAREQAQVNARTTLDSLTASICVLDEHGTIVSTNAAWRAFGRANGGLAAGINEGASYLRACDQGAAGAAVGALALGAALREVLAGRLERFDGEYPCHSPTEQRWFTVRITRLARSHPVHVVITHVDISERKSTELALLESERRWQFAVEGAGDGLWDRDLVSHRTTYSRRWKEMLGYAEHEIGDAPDEWASRVHPDDREQALALSQACHQGRVPSFSCEFRMRCKDGNWKWILDRGTVATRAADGTPLRMIGTHSDISERKQAEATRAELEAQLREAQKMEVVGTLASSIAHDFNNIMGAVLGNVALALEALEPQHPAAGYLDQLQKAGLRARSLVQKILSTSRRQHQAMQPQWLQPLVEQDIELLRATLPRGVTLEARVSSAALSADVDATQLNQVLLNLGTNAWHALQGAPGRVEIGLEALSARAEGGSESRNEGGAVFDGRPATACAHLWVRDEGCGMDEAIRARIFEPFFTTKAVGRGTGLGLAMVQRIVHAHGGTIGVDTVPGQGSCFHVYLPLTPMPDLALQGKDGGDTAAADLATACGQHVMYIDDDEFMTMLVAELLPRAGLRVTCFEAAEQALAALRAAPDSFELVITDFNMPCQSGLDVAKAIALMRPGLPVIITSGQITDELVEGARQAGVCGLVNKERTFEDLAAETLRVLARL